MTYSIVARDQQTGELGVAVQSHWFGVGPLVPWARPGVGAVATQANARAAYGPEALALLERGVNAPDALARLTAADPGAAGRQVAIIDAHGRTATHTGSSAIAYAGHVSGEQVSCQANMMASESVWGAMLEAFRTAAGPLASRLLAALDAAEQAGGDVRGRQSAALLVVPAAGEGWECSVSLRVEDHPEPLVELRRLLNLHSAYEQAGIGDALTNEARHPEAAEHYRLASELAPGNHELIFWAGLGIALSDDVDRGVELVREAISLQPGWADLLPRLTADVAPSAPVVCERLGL
ncbi:MAG TPA: DUF1028 domain-containing protein [Solirubrobacteraceae bacterium]|nr:DUF1028 domain-containing protein [Solirubrobacteraceae bacterium]